LPYEWAWERVAHEGSHAPAAQLGAARTSAQPTRRDVSMPSCVSRVTGINSLMNNPISSKGAKAHLAKF